MLLRQLITKEMIKLTIEDFAIVVYGIIKSLIALKYMDIKNKIHVIIVVTTASFQKVF
jgi:hypothetical protein